MTVAIWIAISLNFGLSLLVLSRISGVLDAGPGRIVVGPPEGTVVAGAGVLGDLPPTKQASLVVALSASCPGCRRVRRKLLAGDRPVGLQIVALSLDGNPEGELVGSGVPVVQASSATELVASLEVSGTPSYYVVDGDGHFLGGGQCSGRQWEAFFD